MESNKNEQPKKDNKDAIVKPDPETLHTTDPQEHMKGPVSSLMQDVKKEAEKEDTPGPADKENAAPVSVRPAAYRACHASC